MLPGKFSASLFGRSSHAAPVVQSAQLRRRKFDSGSTNLTLPFGAQLTSISKHSAIACWTSENQMYANFVELRKAEVQLRRILLPRTPVNKAKKRAEAARDIRPSHRGLT